MENACDGETLRVARLHASRTLTARANRNRIVKVRTQLPGRGGLGGGGEVQWLFVTKLTNMYVPPKKCVVADIQ